MGDVLLNPKDLAGRLARVRLDCFLRSGAVLDLTPQSSPRVSVLIPLYNRAEVTLTCFQSLALRYNRTSLEVIIVDNGSEDETAALLDRVRGLTVVRNPTNLGFPKAVNQGAALARGDYLLLLNNDTEVLGRGIDQAVAYMDAHPEVGIVGGRVVLLDGSLQEAGCGIDRDGWVFQYGRGLTPNDPACTFQRDVDYCSAACLMIRENAFKELNGFEELYTPGYYEDVDFSVRLTMSGRRIVYLPEMTILHYENATSGQMLNPTELCTRHRQVFADRHRDWLRQQLVDELIPPLWGRSASLGRFRVLLVGSIPDFDRQTEGLGQLLDVAEALEQLGNFVTMGLIGTTSANGEGGWEGLSDETELIPLPGVEALPQLLRDRDGFYDLVLFPQPPDPSSRAELARQTLAWAVYGAGGYALAG